MTDPQISSEQLLAQQAAEAAATAKVEELKTNLIQTLGGKEPEKAPESWSALKNETVEMAVNKAEERITAKFEAERKAEQDRTAETIKQTAAQKEIENKKEWETMSAQWKEAVADGILPDISEEIKTKLASGVQYNQLTPEEQKDAGLTAYNDARANYVKQRSEGKSSSFYRTALLEKNRKPAGMSAPVLGSSTPVSNTNELTYAEVSATRRKNFGF